jgi:hypothetical protein
VDEVEEEVRGEGGAGERSEEKEGKRQRDEHRE